MTDLSDINFSGHWAVLPPDLDPIETQGVAGGPRRHRRRTKGAERATFLLRKLLDHARALRVPHAAGAQHAVLQHDLARRPAAVSRQPRDRAAARSRWCAGTRSRWWCAPTALTSELGGHIASYASAADLFEVGFNHFFRAGQIRRPRVLPAALRARHLRARLPRRPAEPRSTWTTIGARSAARACRRTATRELMPEFWQFPTGSMGLGPDHRHLPGALPALPREPRHPRRRRAQGLGVRRRRRDGRARVARRPVARRARGARQPDLRGQLQPAAARRPGARQRLGRSRSWRACSPARAGT